MDWEPPPPDLVPPPGLDERDDVPPPELLDDLLAESHAASGVAPAAAVDPALVAALAAIGLQPADDLEITLGEAPFHDPVSGAAVWFGTLQPDPEDRGYALTGVLSAHPEPDGPPAVAFAPCAVGSLDDCQAQAFDLIATAQRDGLGPALDQALDLAQAHAQPQRWLTDWGTPLPDTPAADVAARTPDLDLDR
jgi:hypothetical protein